MTRRGVFLSGAVLMGARRVERPAAPDPRGVLRVFGDRAFVDAFAERYGAPLP